VGKLYYKKSVGKDFKRIDKHHAKKIKEFIEDRFSDDSVKYEKLKGELEGLCRAEIGRYRVVFKHYKDGYLILRVSHRKEVYR